MTGMSSTDTALYLLAGVVLGTMYFVLLFQTVRLHASRAPAIFIVPFYFLRLGAAVSALWFIAQQGAFPLLVSFLGFLIARIIAQFWKKSN